MMSDTRATADCMHCGERINRRPHKPWVHATSLNRVCRYNRTTVAAPMPQVA